MCVKKRNDPKENQRQTQKGRNKGRKSQTDTGKEGIKGENLRQTQVKKE
jgi:hypothetical protein